MAAGIVVDTSIIIAHLRARTRTATDFERAVKSGRTCHVSAVSVWEIEYGAIRAGRLSDLDHILPLVNVLPFGFREAQIAARIYAELKLRSRDIGIRDAFIAGTCLAHNFPLLTANVGHFASVPGLEVLGRFRG